MQLDYRKMAVVGAWMLAWSVTALTLTVTSPIGWVVLVGSGLLPPLMLMLMWRHRSQTMSESIRNVLK